MNGMQKGIAAAIGMWLGATGCGGAGAGASGGAQEPTAAELFQVKIHRSLRAGSQLRVQVDAQQRVDVSVQGASQRIDGMSANQGIRIDARVVVGSVDPVGRLAEGTLTIDSAVEPVSGLNLFEPGTVVHVNREGEEIQVWLDEGELSPRQVRALVLAFPFERPGSPLGDQLLGTDAPKAVGDTWSLDRRFVTEDLVDEGFETNETDVRGNVTLTDVIDCAGVRCLVITANLEATQAVLVEYADAASFETGELSGTVIVHAPTDPDLFLRREEARFTGNFVADFEGEDGPARRAITVTRQRTATYAPAE